MAKRTIRKSKPPKSPRGEESKQLRARLKRVEAALRASGERYDLAMRAIQEGIYDWNIEKGTIFYSRQAMEQTRSSRENSRTPEDWRRRIHPEDLPEYERRLVEHFKGKAPSFECDYRYRLLEGGWRWARQHGIAIRDKKGRAVRLIGSTGDITELKQGEERQAATAEILKVISRATKDVQPVFDAIAERSLGLLAGWSVVIWRVDGEHVRPVSFRGGLPGSGEVMRDLLSKSQPLTSIPFLAEALRDRAPKQIRDAEAKGVAPLIREGARIRGWRSNVAVPMLQGGEVIGMITLSRSEPGGFTEQEIDVLKTFADQAVIAVENVRLFNETREALERQTATGEILRVISTTPTDTQPVFDVIVQSTQRIMVAKSAILLLRREKDLYVAAYSIPGLDTIPPDVREAPLDPEKNYPSRVMLECKVVHIPDWEADDVIPFERFVARSYGIGSGVQVPLVRKGEGIGALVATRAAKGPFAEKEIALLRSFADQAVIAIENVRLFNETNEALSRQTATAEVLRVISRSPADVRPVFDAIVTTALGLLSCVRVGVLVRQGDYFHGVHGEHGRPPAVRPPMRIDPAANFPSRVFAEKRVLHLPDWSKLELTEHERRIQADFGCQSSLMVPLMRAEECVGTLVFQRNAPVAFDEKEISLAQSFADQAVIAIENARLFNETKEALEQQTAISEVLRVISSSPADVTPVLDAVAARAAKICEASDARIFLVDGNVLRLVTGFGDVPLSMTMGDAVPISRSTASGRSVVDRGVVHIEDMMAAPAEEFPLGREVATQTGWHTVLSVPLMRENRALGAIVLRRMEVRAFAEKHIAMLRTFADQAAIAIENVRLFKETQESLERQTATAEVLKTISRSTFDLDKVLQALLDNAARLGGARQALMLRPDEAGNYLPTLWFNWTADLVNKLRERPIRPGRDSTNGRALLEKRPIHIPDVRKDAEYGRQDLVELAGFRSVLSVPMLRDGEAIGLISLTGVEPFTDKQMELITTFADQAVIAIENVRLFREIEEKSRQLEEASKHKSQFLASMSHELRTPLNAILGFNEMLIGGIYGDVPGDMLEPLKDIQTSGKHLLRLINNVLDLAKIEAGRMELALADYSVHETVAGVQATLRALAAEKGLDFVATVPEDIPLAYGDAGRLTQCLMNLAGNSLKFTKTGKVEIAVARNDGVLRYCVSDTGIGIPPDKIGTLFTEFKQTDATIASEYGGTGLGLSITRKFIEMHGGRVWVESELGKGSSFIFEIPLRAQS